MVKGSVACKIKLTSRKTLRQIEICFKAIVLLYFKVKKRIEKSYFTNFFQKNYKNWSNQYDWTKTNNSKNQGTGGKSKGPVKKFE